MNKIAYLTIDDAPSPGFISKLDFLDERGVKAIWFSQGNHMERRPEMVIEALRRGHIIGNHAYSHPHFSQISLDQGYAEIRATDAVIEDLHQRAGVPRTQRYFRFPYGDKGDSKRADLQAYLRELGYVQPAFADITYAYWRSSALATDVDWYWTFDTVDWALTVDWTRSTDAPPHGIDSVEKILARIDEDVPEGGRGLNYEGSADIVLTHDFEHTHTGFVAEVQRMLDKGVQFKLPV